MAWKGVFMGVGGCGGTRQETQWAHIWNDHPSVSTHSSSKCQVKNELSDWNADVHSYRAFHSDDEKFYVKQFM